MGHLPIYSRNELDSEFSSQYLGPAYNYSGFVRIRYFVVQLLCPSSTLLRPRVPGILQFSCKPKHSRSAILELYTDEWFRQPQRYQSWQRAMGDPRGTKSVLRYLRVAVPDGEEIQDCLAQCKTLSGAREAAIISNRHRDSHCRSRYTKSPLHPGECKVQQKSPS